MTPGLLDTGRLLRRIDATDASVDPLDFWSVLSNHRRRRVIRLLEELDTPVDLRALADAVATDDISPVEDTDRARQSIYVSLYQHHVPTLDAAGAIRWDEDAGTVRDGPAMEAYRIALDVADKVIVE